MAIPLKEGRRGADPGELRIEAGTRARLINLRTGERLLFHYNPGEWDDSYSSNFAEVNIPGGTTPLFQFGSGGSRDLSLQLFFNEYKQESSRAKNFIQMSVEDSIRFIQRAMEPKQAQILRPGFEFSVSAAPDPLVFVWGILKFNGIYPGIEVLVSDLRVKRSFFRKGSLEGIRAICDVTLRAIRLGPV